MTLFILQQDKFENEKRKKQGETEDTQANKENAELTLSKV